MPAHRRIIEAAHDIVCTPCDALDGGVRDGAIIRVTCQGLRSVRARSACGATTMPSQRAPLACYWLLPWHSACAAPHAQMMVRLNQDRESVGWRSRRKCGGFNLDAD